MKLLHYDMIMIIIAKIKNLEVRGENGNFSSDRKRNGGCQI